MRGDWMMDGGMGIWMVINMAFWVLVFIGIALLVIWFVRMVGRGERRTVEGSALEILKKDRRAEKLPRKSSRRLRGTSHR